jgi:hypothetical protein
MNEFCMGMGQILSQSAFSDKIITVKSNGQLSNHGHSRFSSLINLVNYFIVQSLSPFEKPIWFTRRNSSVGRALDWRSKGPWFDPGFRQLNFNCFLDKLFWQYSLSLMWLFRNLLLMRNCIFQLLFINWNPISNSYFLYNKNYNYP